MAFDNLLLLKDKNVPVYYELNKGWIKELCAFAESPKRLLAMKMADNSFISTCIALAILAIPMLVGQAFNAIIYRVAAEKIKKQDYEAEFDQWLMKTYNNKNSNGEYFKKFIDYCIQNRIKANDCPNYIIERPIDQYGIHYIFEFDGVASSLIKGISMDNSNQKIKALVLWHPLTRSAEKSTNLLMFSKEDGNPYPLSQEFKQYYEISCNTHIDLINKCTFVVFHDWMFNNQKTTDYIYQTITSVS